MRNYCIIAMKSDGDSPRAHWHGHCKIIVSRRAGDAAATMGACRCRRSTILSIRKRGLNRPAAPAAAMSARSSMTATRAALQCAPVDERRQALRGRRRLGGDARGVSAGRRAPRLPEIGRRLDRARGDLAVLPAQDRDRGVRARRRAREEGPQGRLHPDHLRDADHHGAADGLLCQARPQRRGDQDRRLGGDPRQDAQQGIRRRPHAVADAARDHARRRLESDPLHDAGGREHQRPGDHARDQAQGQARSEVLEGLQVRGAVRLLDAQLPAALLRRRARHRSRHRHPDPRRAAAGDGRQPARRQYRRLPRRPIR